MSCKKCSVCWETGSCKIEDVHDFPGEHGNNISVVHTSNDENYYTEIYYQNLPDDEVKTICIERAIDYMFMQIQWLNEDMKRLKELL